MAKKFGALQSIDRGDFDKLSMGVQSQNNPLSIFGYNVSPTDVLTTGLGFTGISAPMAVGGMIGKYQAEEAANKLLGNTTNFMDNIKQPSNTASAISQVRSRADLNKDGVVTNFEMNRFGQTIPGLDLAPMYDYKQDDQGNPLYNMIKGSGGQMMPADARANPYSSGRLSRQMNAPKEKGTKANEFRSAMGSYALKDMADQGTGMKSASDYRADGIKQTNVIGMEGYDPNFAKAVTRENQKATGTYISQEEQSNQPTYICTALYEMGEMKKYIYKYDQVYGKRVDPNVYRGYCVWGKYVATKLKRKGIVYKIVKPLALAWAKQMAFDLSKGRYGKNNKVVKAVSKIGEGICFVLGMATKINFKKGVKYG